jgi:excisionase family DNA binding protein
VGAVKVKTACELLDMNESRVRQLIRDGRLKVIRPTPQTIRIPLSEIRRFTEEES